MIDLIQEAYHSGSNKIPKYIHGNEININDISVVIFFITLREALLENFLHEIAIAKNVPKNIFERLKSDNKLYIKKQNALFLALTDDKWEDAIQKLNYVDLNSFIKNAANIRNIFIHEGNKYCINRDISEKCLSKTPELVRFYVDLHNKYIHPIYLKNQTHK